MKERFLEEKPFVEDTTEYEGIETTPTYAIAAESVRRPTHLFSAMLTR